MGISTLPQNLQEAAVTIFSEKFECHSQESLPKFNEHLFLMTTFKVYHMCREHGEGTSKIGGTEGASFNVWRSRGRDSLEKEKQGVWGGGGVGLPRKRKISTSFLYCS